MEKLWTTTEVAQYLGITEAEVELLIREGRLTGYKLGGKFLRFRPDQVKGLTGLVSSRPHDTLTSAQPSNRWPTRLRDFLYFYDFYLVSFLLLVGLVLYFITTT